MRRLWESAGVRFVREILEVYFDRRVSRSAAELAYFLILSFFPVLICVNAFVGLLHLDVNLILAGTEEFLPKESRSILGDYIQGMATTVLLRNDTLPGRPTAQEIHQALSSYYAGQTFVSVAPFGGDEPVIYSDTLVGTNQLRLIVCGHEAQTTVTALFDNLGKGASGAAVQNMNLMLGFAETAGLE